MVNIGTDARMVFDTDGDHVSKKLADHTTQLADLGTQIRPSGSDDTTAIQNAINAASSSGGGVILLSKGTFLCSNLQMKSNVILKGNGIRTTILKNNVSGNPVIWAGTLTNAITGASIESLMIDGQGTATNGIKLISFTNGSRVKDVYITNAGSNLYISNAWYSNITNVQTNNAIKGIEIDTSNGGAVNTVQFSNCYSNIHTQYALHIHGDGTTNGSVHGLTFNSCTFEHSTSYGANIVDHINGVIFESCYFENNDLADTNPTQVFINLGFNTSDGGIVFTGGQISQVSNGIGINCASANSLTVEGVHFSWNGQGANPLNHVKSLAGFTNIIAPSVDGFCTGGHQNDFNITANTSIVQGNAITMLNNVQSTTNLNQAYTVFTANYDFTVSPLVPILLGNATSGAIFANLPQPQNCKGTRFFVKKIDTSTNPVYVKESSLGTQIDGVTFYYLRYFGDYVEFISDGTGFRKISGNTSGWQNASLSDIKAGTTSTSIVTLTPTVQRNYSVKIYYRVVTAATNVTITLTYTDASGAQTITLVNGTSQAVGVYTITSPFINALSTAPITVSATAGTANQVFVSASIVPE